MYFFRGDEYVRFDIGADKVDSGSRKKPPPTGRVYGAEGIDAAVLWPDKGAEGKMYFFRGDEYIRYDLKKDKADSGYPKKIAPYWPGVWAEGIDAAVYRPSNRKIYFFRGDEYIRFDTGNDEADSGYPKKIAAGWAGVWPEGIDATAL